MDYKATKAWRQAMTTSIQLCRLAEELPQQEEQALAPMLRAAAIDLVSFVAVDLLAGIPARFDALVRLESILLVIDDVYPAIDTAEVETLIEQLRTQLHIYTFSELATADEYTAEEETAVEDEDATEIIINDENFDDSVKEE